jgi:hypothetical protein
MIFGHAVHGEQTTRSPESPVDGISNSAVMKNSGDAGQLGNSVETTQRGQTPRSCWRLVHRTRGHAFSRQESDIPVGLADRKPHRFGK